MNVLICPDSFKGTLTAVEAAEAMERGVKRTAPEVRCLLLPVADGGEGTCMALSMALARTHRCKMNICLTLDPIGRPIEASYLIAEPSEGNEKTMAVIETAAAGGLPLLKPEERNVYQADTRGTALLIADAYGRGIRKFLIGLGGSATCDGGLGAYEALAELHRKSGFPETGPLLPDASFTLLCDVENPMCGPNGAAAVFAPQKGAREEDIPRLESRNLQLARFYRQFRGIDVAQRPFAGAAGGLAGMLLACTEARAVSGGDKILELSRFESLASECHLVITGEGRLDLTTLSGKAPASVMRKARAKGAVVAAVGGTVNNKTELYEAGFNLLQQATPSELKNSAMTDRELCIKLVEEAAANIMNEFLRLESKKF